MEKVRLGKEPAFPQNDYVLENCGAIDFNPMGMSKRFYAACAAMQGLIINFSESRKVNEGFIAITDHKELISEAYEFADELLKQENV